MVDLLREQRRDQVGPARRHLESLGSERLRVSVHVVCELFAGVELSAHGVHERRRVERICRRLDIVYPDSRFAALYGRIVAGLQRAGQLISTMDLLIATSALLDQAVLVTGNAKHFQRVPGLALEVY